MPDLSSLSNEELLTLLYDPSKALEKAGSPAAPAQINNTLPPNPEAFKMRSGISSLLLGNPSSADANSSPDFAGAVVDPLVNTAAMVGGSALGSKAISAGTRLKNALLGTVKGAGLEDVTSRTKALLSGKEQPELSQQLGKDIFGGALGGVGGALSAPSKKMLAQKAQEALQEEFKNTGIQLSSVSNHYNKLSNTIKNTGEELRTQQNVLRNAEKNAKTEAQQAYHTVQKKFATNIAEGHERVFSAKNAFNQAKEAFNKFQETEAKELQDAIAAKKEQAAKYSGVVQSSARRQARQLEDELAQKTEKYTEAMKDAKAKFDAEQRSIQFTKVDAAKHSESFAKTNPQAADVEDTKKLIDLLDTKAQQRQLLTDLFNQKEDLAHHARVLKPELAGEDTNDLLKMLSYLPGKVGMAGRLGTKLPSIPVVPNAGKATLAITPLLDQLLGPSQKVD